MFFSNRTAAGRQLAGELARLGLVEPVVLGLPAAEYPWPQRSHASWAHRWT